MANTDAVFSFQPEQTTGIPEWNTTGEDLVTDGRALRPIVGLWNPTIDVSTIAILSVVIIGGNANIMTFLAYFGNRELREKPLNMLVLAMAAADFLLCEVGGTLELVQTATSLTGYSTVWCGVKLCLLGFCHFTTISLIAWIAVYRLYLVLRRYMQGSISKKAAYTAVIVSFIVGCIRVLGRLRNLKTNVNMIRCVGFAVGLPDPSDVKDFLFIVALVCAVVVYVIQYGSFILKLPSASDSNVVGVGQGTPSGVDHNSISTGLVGVLTTILTFLIYLLPGLPYQFGYRPEFVDTLNHHALMRSLLYLHAVIKPLLYLCLVPIYRRSIFMINQTQLVISDEPAVENVAMAGQNGQP